METHAHHLHHAPGKNAWYYFYEFLMLFLAVSCGYPLTKKLFGHAAFFQNSGTLDQLKNSGGLRLIRRRNVVDSIQAYEQQIKRIELRDIYETDCEFLNSLMTFRSFITNVMALQGAVKEKATRLIALIKTEYKLE